jgi:hypothetical protein
MTQLATAPRPRLAYDDASTPAEMFGDCRAAGLTLALPHPADAALASARRPDRPASRPAIEVPLETASMAGALHLHLS